MYSGHLYITAVLIAVIYSSTVYIIQWCLSQTANYTNEGHLVNGTLIRLKMYNNAPTNFYTGNDKLGIVHFLDGLDGKSATRKVLRARYVS